MSGFKSPRLAVALVAGLILALGATSASGGGVGGPPTIDFPRCDRFLRPCGPPVVLGRPRHFLGPVEVIGMHYEGHGGGLCTFIDTVRTGSGYGGCGPGSPQPPPGDAIEHTGIATGDYRRERTYTQITGQLAPDVARVQARYWRHGELQIRKVAVIQVEGELLAAIEEPEPFGIFEMTVRGCLAGKRIRLRATDAAGEVLQRIRGFRARGICGGAGGVAGIVTRPSHQARYDVG